MSAEIVQFTLVTSVIPTCSNLLALGLLLLNAACVQRSLVGDGTGTENPRLSASSMSVQAGDSVTLTWQAAGPRAYLSGVGVVSTQGTAVVVPRLTTTYRLVTDVPTQTEDVTISIFGIKGDTDFFPKLNDYSGKLENNKSIGSLVDYLGSLHRLLQDDLKFSLNEFCKGDTCIFQTHSSEVSEFLPIKEYGMRSQRISLLVSVKKISTDYNHIINTALPEPPLSSKRSKLILVNISAAINIQYQRASEEQWRTNNNSDLNREKASTVLSRMLALQ